MADDFLDTIGGLLNRVSQFFEKPQVTSPVADTPPGASPDTTTYPQEEIDRAYQTAQAAVPDLKTSKSMFTSLYNKYGPSLIAHIPGTEDKNSAANPEDQGQAPESTNTPAATDAPAPTDTAAPDNKSYTAPVPSDATGGLTPDKFKYQNSVEKVAKELDLPVTDFHLIRAGENMKEDPNAVNKNSNGTEDVGLNQVNVDPSDTEEVEKLKDPMYNYARAGKIFKKYQEDLKDPVMALGAYNKGEQGAIDDPTGALARAQWVYYKAGLKMPQTKFAEDPEGYVSENKDYFEGLGFNVSGD